VFARLSPSGNGNLPHSRHPVDLLVAPVVCLLVSVTAMQTVVMKEELSFANAVQGKAKLDGSFQA
jgi:hypothetical protein